MCSHAQASWQLCSFPNTANGSGAARRRKVGGTQPRPPSSSRFKFAALTTLIPLSRQCVAPMEYCAWIVLFHHDRTRLVAAVAATRLPAIFGYREMADAGGLMSYGPQIAGFPSARHDPREQDPEGREAC